MYVGREGDEKKRASGADMKPAWRGDVLDDWNISSRSIIYVFMPLCRNTDGRLPKRSETFVVWGASAGGADTK